MIERDWAELEHRLGVLPLLAAFFAPGGELDEVAAGRKLGALALFTPTSEPGWAAAAVAGEPAGPAESAGRGVLLRGDVRLPWPAADGSLVLVRLAEAEHRLAWLDHGAPGIERRGSRTGGPAGLPGGGPCWLHLDGVTVSSDLVSRPVALGGDGELSRLLTTYAVGWAAAAADCAGLGVRALRRAARTSGLQAAQLIALGITEVEIEVELASAALRQAGEGGGLALAVAASRALAAVAAKTEELRDSFGLAVDGPLAGGAARTLTAFLGGPLVLEGELARTLGIPE